MSDQNGNGPDERSIRAAIAAHEPPQLDFEAIATRLAAQAEERGLLEVAYTSLDSPIGELMIAATEAGLVRVGWARDDRDLWLAELAVTIGPRVIEAPGRLESERRQLEEYFDGRRRDFDLELDWRLSAGFTRKVLTETWRIPYGETRTYGEVAAAAGSPRAFRAAGSALGANPIPVVVPCHRVLRAGGALGGYGGGLDVKQTLLELEGSLPVGGTR
jgi:methylated-DNA-[protein]-cysteine S-methyltransferase